MLPSCLHYGWNLQRVRLCVRHFLLRASDFPSVLQERIATTPDIYNGVPLSTLPPSVRGDVLEDVAQRVDIELNKESNFGKAVLDKRYTCCRRGRT